MTTLVRHLTSLARLLFTSLPLDIATPLSIQELRQRMGSLPFAYGLALAWEGRDHFRVQSQSSGVPYRGSQILPIIELRLVERDGAASLHGFASLPAFPRSVLMVILAAFALFAVGILTRWIPSNNPVQALPIVGLALSILELVHLAALYAVRRTLARLADALGSKTV